jgi:CRISPR-associated endonuclease/helicase Cas3
MPQDLDRLVQAVYGDVALPNDVNETDRDWIEVGALGAYRGKCNTEAMMARNVAIDVEAEPQVAYLDKSRGYEAGEEGLGLPNETRLGDEAIALVPVHVGIDGWRIHPDGPAFDPEQLLSDTMAKALYARQIKVSRKALVKHLTTANVPKAFAEHPLLRHIRPLPLTQGCAEIGRLRVHLDEELGLVYQKKESA